MARAQGARAQLLLAFESTYGTAPASGFTRIPFVRSTLGSEQPLIDSDLLGYGRDPLAPIKDALTADGEVSIPLDAHALGFWLKGAFGAPTTTDNGDGTFDHVFASGGWDLPSLAIEAGLPDLPRFAMYSGCVVDQLSWTMQRSGQLTGAVTLVAQNEAKASTTQGGTPASIELARFGHFNGSIKREGSALANVTSAQVTYANNLDRVETIRSDGLIAGADPSVAALTGRIDARFADETLLDQALAGEACELEFAYALADGSSFTLTAHAVYLPRPRVSIEGPQGVQVSFDWQAALAASPARMATATLINEVASY
ncbi:hypothetical protein SAMN05444336_112119 [Albimonas donghaensis]|uniref:Uncharacterized protein n=1 Tax=Albimonas donghaensis TaxID=356660 RepID=A0A1H3FHR9_9RHOB|nr:phage tail tube protein [Albimonas donghaensis]SDX90385.1 hypothetical protein SAMN05444336_112119 [Albimonas donghaensis]